jgi:ATP-dependent DNA helicase DinG
MFTRSLQDVASTPADLGLPSKFASWRPVQEVAILDALDSPKRFVVQNMSTGSGKGLSAVAQAFVHGRGEYLTATKALQKQLLDDFEPAGMVDIRGRNNYRCAYTAANSRMSCEDGRHLGCKANRDSMCPYVNQLNRARSSSLPTTNYDYHIASNKYGDGLGDVNLLICDEADRAVDRVCDALTVDFHTREVRELAAQGLQTPDHTAPLGKWIEWSIEADKMAKARIEKLSAEVKRAVGTEGVAQSHVLQQLKEWVGLSGRLTKLTTAEGRWVADDLVETAGNGYQRTGIRWQPIWPAPFTEQLLWLDVPHVLLTSATVSKKTCSLLGVPTDEMDFFTYPSSFDPSRCPITHIKTERVDVRMTDMQKRSWVSRIDQIIRKHPGQKGIIHCVSYDRQKDIYRLSGERERLKWHNSWATEKTIQEFKEAPESSGMVLISPAVVAGYDFPDEQCRFIIVAKLPMQDTRSKIMKARLEEDADYANYLAGQHFEQSVGRAMRNEKDWCEVTCVDDHWVWWFPKMVAKGYVTANVVRRVEAGRKGW